jgi:hypothetical protein
MLMRMMDAWVRGTHPWCGWMRLFLLPLMLAPVWLGYMWGGMLVMTAWMMMPMLFRKPSRGDSWMTRACFGLQIWRSRPLDDPLALLLLVMTIISLALALVAAGHQAAILLAGCVASYFLTYLTFLARQARSFDRSNRKAS